MREKKLKRSKIERVRILRGRSVMLVVFGEVKSNVAFQVLFK